MAIKNVAVIFAAGTGERLKPSTKPKQFLELCGKPVLAYTIEHFQKHPEIDGIVLVTLSGWIDYCKEMAAALHFDKIAAIEAGGNTSQDSVRVGLEAVRRLYGEDAVVLIHDGVRPLIDAEAIGKCIRCVCENGNAITVSPQMETIMIGDKAEGPCHIVERDKCRVARAPQCFYLKDILEARRRAAADHKFRFIDSASLMEYYGYELHSVEGPLENIKITTTLDFRIFQVIMEDRKIADPVKCMRKCRMYTECPMPTEDFEYICGADFVPWERLRGKTVLITGATGLIGFTLTGALLYANGKRNLGLTVLALVRDKDQAARRFGGYLTDGAQLRLLTGTVDEPPEPEEAVDYIIHGASLTSSKSFVQHPVETIRTAVLGTLQMLEMARRKKTSGFVYLSSMEVYGHPVRGHKVTEADACSLRSADVRDSYPISKLQCESMCRAYADEYGVPAAIARLAQTFGPGAHPDDARIFAELGRCIRDKRDIVLRTSGETERSYLYTADAAAALLTILLKGQPGQAYNAADESTYCSIAEMARRMAEAGGIHVRFDPDDGRICGYPEPVYMDLDTSLLQSLGWSVGKRGTPGEHAFDTEDPLPQKADVGENK